MNPFEGVSGRRRKRKPKSEMIEVKQEPNIKEEPSDSIIDMPRPRANERYRVNYDGPVNFNDDFNEVKDGIKCEEEEDTGKDKDSAPCGRSNDNAATNDDDNICSSLGYAMDVQPPKPLGSGKKREGSAKKQKKRAIPRNQAAKKQKKHKCHVCNHVADCDSHLKVHLRIHTGEKPHRCEVCSKSFAQKSNLNHHKKTHGQFRCSKCNRRFEQESAKIDHETLCNPCQFECDTCGYRTMRKSDLITHIRIHTGAKPFGCSICFKSFVTNTHLRRHSMTHIEGPPGACSKCGRRFATPDDKQSHETHCQGSLFACNQCHYKAIQKSHLKRHMQSKHGAKRSIECEICNKKFVERIVLNQHLSTAHSDQFPSQCSKCFGGYASEVAKIAHEDSCGRRQYQCHLCKEYSRNKYFLKIHMRKDHTGERIQCKLCAASFASKGSTNRHTKAVHRLKK